MSNSIIKITFTITFIIISRIANLMYPIVNLIKQRSLINISALFIEIQFELVHQMINQRILLYLLKLIVKKILNFGF